MGWWRFLQAQCSFTFADDHPGEVPEDEADWACPHDSHGDSRYCVFHMPVEEKEEAGVSEAEVKHELLRKISSPGERRKQFRGAVFRDLDLGHAVLEAEDNHPIDLSHARFEGSVDLSHTDVYQPLLLEGARIGDRLWMTKAEFESYCNLRDVTFEGFEDGKDAFFHGPVFFERSRFAGAGTYEEYEQFVGSFDGAVFEEKVSFDHAGLEGRLDMRETYIEKALFHSTRLDVLFLGSAEVRQIFLTAVRTVEDEAYVSFAQAHIAGGVLNQPYFVEDGEVRYPDEAVYYNFERARIGDIGLKSDQDGRLFEYVYLLEAEFDGFDFREYEGYLEPGWDLHRYEGPLLKEGNIRGKLTRDREEEPAGREMTYLRARKGAEANGYDRAASAFFINQKRERRYRHLAGAKDGDRSLGVRVKSLAEYAGNRLMGAISGHGERPWRVIGSSLSVIVACALLYPLLGGINSADNGILTYASSGSFIEAADVIGQSLYFSTTTFTTLGFGDLYPVGRPAQLLAGFESLTGALLVALLVFVLGKRS
jgi:uncharacterized protein YjbI with pentapeptide repeats